MAATKLVLFLALFITAPCIYCKDNDLPLIAVIGSLEKLLSFYKENYRDLNLDGLFGLRVLEGHLQLILSEHQNGRHSNITPDILSRLQSMATDSTIVSNQAVEFVKNDDESYFDTMSYVIGQPWNILHKHRKLDPELRWSPKIYKATQDYKIDESTSDMCMAEVTGSNRADKRACIISKKCLNTMTMKGMTEYGVTHQILWTMLAEKANCLQELNDLLQTGVDAMQVEFCTNNFFEMAAVVHIYMHGKIKNEYHDLFLEQQFVCPSLGFYEFLKKEYLDQVLSWQFPSGCFGDPPNSTTPSTNVDLKMKLQQLHQKMMNRRKDSQANFVNNANSLPQNPAANIQKVNLQNNKSITFNQQGQKIDLNFVHSENILNPNILSRLVSQQPTYVNKQQLGMDNINKNYNLVNNNFRVQPMGEKPVNTALNRDVNIKNSIFLQAMQPGGAGVQPNNQPVINGENMNIGRRLLAEKEMKDGCLAHTTAVATGGLVMYLRYLIDPGPTDFYGSHHILQETSRSLLGEEIPVVGGDTRKVKQEGLIPVNRGELDPNIDLIPDKGADGINPNEIMEDEDDEDEEDDDDDDDYDGDGKDDPDYNNEEDEDNEFYPDGDKADKNNLPVVHFGVKPKDIELQKNIFEGDDLDTKYRRNNADEGDYTYYDDDSDAQHKQKFKDVLEEKNMKNDVKINNNDINNDNNIIIKDDSNIKVSPVQPVNINSEKLSVIEPIPPAFRTIFVFLSVFCFILLILMFRFIKKRRIHIRYHPRGFFR